MDKVKHFSESHSWQVMALGFQPLRAGPRPHVLTTSRWYSLRQSPPSQNFSPNTGMGCEAWVQTNTGLAQPPKANFCSGRTSLYLWISCREHAGDETDGQRGLSSIQNDCQFVTLNP